MGKQTEDKEHPRKEGAWEQSSWGLGACLVLLSSWEEREAKRWRSFHFTMLFRYCVDHGKLNITAFNWSHPENTTSP